MIDLSLEKKLIAFCGFYCRLCPFYTGEFRTKARDYHDFLAPMKNALSGICMEKNLDFEKFWEVLEFFSNSGLCVGCKMGGGWEECPIRRCALKKQIDYCILCPDYPCDEMQRRGYTKYSEILKKKGIDAFIREKLNLKQ